MTRPLEEIQWRNIHKVVNALADLCFGGPKDPQYGIMHVAITTSLTAKDGLDTSNLGLEPLVAPAPEVVQQALQSEDLSGHDVGVWVVRVCRAVEAEVRKQGGAT